MYFEYILLLSLAVASNGMFNTSLISRIQEDCTPEQFKCFNGNCIHGDNQCDGHFACQDGSDELNCPDCTEDQFKCANGKCIPGKNRCDGFQECKEDGSDELNCKSCTGDAFSCGDGECIHNAFLCDLYDDCADGRDENNCTNHVCGSNEFLCQSGQCIHDGGICDGKSRCADKSDETNCLECVDNSWGWTQSTFKCVSSNKCISWYQQCDSIKDCPDGSDEDEATCQSLQCAEGETQCWLGHCVRRSWFCEGVDPCGQDHDTKNFNFTCPKCPVWDMFKCKTENRCIKNYRLCDAVPDCDDGSDESGSTCSAHKCTLRNFQCQSGQCVDNSGENTIICNGHPDCGDGSDEANCTNCTHEAIKCGSGECVHKLYLCNSKVECSDGSDENEINCPNGSTPLVMTTPWRVSWPTYRPNVTLQHLTEDLAVYFDSSVSPSVTWPFLPVSQAWKYAKKTFQLESLLEPGSQFLYVVLGKFKENHENNFSFRSRKSGYRNIIDPGLRERNGWVTQNLANLEKLVSSIGNIVEIVMEGVENKADKKLCDSTLRDIVFYDIYIHLKGQESADVVQYKANQFNRSFQVGQYKCFQDWFLPVYEKFGGAIVLNNYFHIFKKNYPKNRGDISKFVNFQYKGLNIGEFVHFWSGAAGEDLRYLAKTAFNNWNDVFMRQFAKAQTDFPNITYQSKLVSGKYQNIVNINYSN